VQLQFNKQNSPLLGYIKHRLHQHSKPNINDNLSWCPTPGDCGVNL